MEGIKNKADVGKLRTDMISPHSEIAIAAIMTDTMKSGKYDDHSWAEGVDFSMYYGALKRHMLAWYMGEDLDPQSGLPHMWHAHCCTMILAHYAALPEMYSEFDDRAFKYEMEAATQ